MKKNGVLMSAASALILVICFAVRVYQIVGCTDMTSGFLHHDSGFFGLWGYYLLLIVAAVGLAVCAVFEEKGSADKPNANDIVDARAAVIGFGMLLTGVCAVYNGVLELDAFTPMAFAAGADFLLGAIMTASAFITLYKKEFKPALGFSYCTGAIYFMLRGVFVFLEHMAITTVPEYLVECLSDIMLSLFFMLLAKYLSANGKKHTRASVVCVGSLAGVLTLSEGLGIIVAKLVAPAEIAERITSSQYTAEFFRQQAQGHNAYMMTYFPWVNLAAGVFALAAALAIVTAKKLPQKAEALPEQDEASNELPDNSQQELYSDESAAQSEEKPLE